MLDGKGLGYRVDPRDSRDYLARGRALRGVATIPDVVDWERDGRLGPVLDQGQTPECVAHGVAVVRTFHERRDSRRTYRWQPRELYRRCKAVDGIPHELGTFPRVALDLLRTEGMGRDGRAYDADAGRYRIASYQRLLTVEEIERALTLGPAIIGLNWAVNWTWRARGVLTEPAGWAGGHLIALAGYDRRARLFTLRQSWGERAHDRGLIRITYVEIARQLALPDWESADAWALVDERRRTL